MYGSAANSEMFGLGWMCLFHYSWERIGDGYGGIVLDSGGNGDCRHG
jgi:hypothetical protein